MPFDVNSFVRRTWYTGLLLLVLAVLVSCTDKDLNEDDASDDFTQRVEDNILPEVVSESEDMLRNLLNFMPVFTEICATPFAALGQFQSQLAALQRAEQEPDDRIRFIDDNDDNDDGTWQVTWRNVVFGAGDIALVDDFAPVKVKLNARYLDQNFATIRAIPFDLTPKMSTPQTAGDPTTMSFTAEGFYLFQDVQTGQWTLRWHANTTKKFKGELSDADFRRVFLNASGTATPDDLDISDSTQTITFEDTTTPDPDKGFTFYVLPGTRIRFKLQISDTGITADQLFIGGMGEPLPSSLDADNFRLSSALPIDPSGEPTFTPGVDLGLFIWQDLDNDQCTSAEDAWHIRFSAPDTSRFTGSIRVSSNDVDEAVLRVPAVLGSCDAANFDGNREIDYNCTPTASENGYDLCATGGQRVRFDPEVNGEKDPSVVFIGAANAAPPSASPFTIQFKMKIEEQDSTEDLKIDDTTLVLRGNRDDNNSDDDDDDDDDDRDELINPDQLSLDPNCVLLLENGEEMLPAVRVTENGDYSTDRFAGSRFELQSTNSDDDSSLNGVDFAFAEMTESSLKTVGRFPDRGRVRLRTRLSDSTEDVKVTAPMSDITAANGRVTSLADIKMTVDDVDFQFRDQPLNLGAE